MKLFSKVINHSLMIYLSLFSLSLVSCVQSKTIREDKVISTINGFFNALDVDNYNCDKLSEWVTEDFMLYEMEKPFTRDQFCDFVDEGLSDMTSTDWVLSDFTISTDYNSAHVYYRNKGRFVTISKDGKELVMNMEWLESAYIIRQKDGKLKIKFLSSDDINN